MTVGTQPRPNSARRRAKKHHDRKTILVTTLLVVLGLAVMVYPVVATQWNNWGQQRAAQAYDRLEKGVEPEQLNTAIELAREYNQTRSTGPILDPWLAQVEKDNGDYKAYTDQLSYGDAMARLLVPAAGVNLPVYHGTDHHTLQIGVGHLYGSDLPVGGEDTHTVLTAHTGLPNATLFDNLTNVKEGDAIYVQVSGEKLKYQVDHIEVVLPNETDSLRPQAGQDLITLVTCTPYGINTHRLLVHGHRVELDHEDLEAFDASPALAWQWWMWAFMAGAVLVALLLAAWLWRALHAHRATRPGQDHPNESDSSESPNGSEEGKQ
ncbi:class C sortase [Corynebacterium lizhenjunii]|uniref:Class C sortase n=1 Tax=Corynebacterium lizhenjunii TaxID=2709394 RepID=A0A7T0PBT8_9CORY|nr:class C sortase [Corynebacterium lizhenjunii]QPK78902.1 class C sortase [Corynebacterium lizhenjunii]